MDVTCCVIFEKLDTTDLRRAVSSFTFPCPECHHQRALQKLTLATKILCGYTVLLI
jgi:cytochrome c1